MEKYNHHNFLGLLCYRYYWLFQGLIALLVCLPFVAIGFLVFQALYWELEKLSFSAHLTLFLGLYVITSGATLIAAAARLVWSFWVKIQKVRDQEAEYIKIWRSRIHSGFDPWIALRR